MSNVIAVDVDEVCADLLTEWIRRYNAEYADTLKVCDIKSWMVSDHVKPECGLKILDYLNDPGMYQAIKPMEHALEAVEELKRIGRVVFVSSCVPGVMDAKFRWLQEHGFLPKTDKAIADYIPSKDKFMVNADVLLDDGVHNVEAFHKLAFLVQHTHNLNTPCKRARVPGMGIKQAPEMVRWWLRPTLSFPPLAR